MFKNHKFTILASASAIMLATILLYFFIFDELFSMPIRWISLLVLLLAEIVTTVKAITARKNILTFTTVITSLIHTLLVLVISIVYISFFPSLTGGYVLLNLLILCILAAIDIALICFGNNIYSKNETIVDAQTCLNMCYTKADSIYIKYPDSEYKDALLNICEMLKFTDNSFLTGEEQDILHKLDELDTTLNANESALDKISELEQIIKLRSTNIKFQKRGSF